MSDREGQLLGEALRERRTRLGFSQDDLARAAGIDVKTVRNIEAGRNRPRPSTLRLLADALRIHGSERDRLIAGGAPSLSPSAGDVKVAPAQLPAQLRFFAGRRRQVAALNAAMDSAAGDAAPAVLVVSGTAGVGKTVLAVHWAHSVSERFPDGQLYVNLRGFSPGMQPVEPVEALRRLLDALGVSGDAMPHDPDARSALFRSLLSGKRLLIVLDDALDAEQVSPLLPGTAGCLALVTSRSQLADLIATVGAEPVALDLLTEQEAEQLLSAWLGERRVAQEATAVADLVGLCARLPLTLSLVAAQAMLRPGASLADLSAELREAGALDGFSGTDIRAVFASSYRTLTTGSAQLFRRLGLQSGPDIGVAAAASLAGVKVTQVRRLLTELTRAHLVTEPRPGRYALHDLLRAYAAELAADDSEARRRLYDHYVHTCQAGATLLNPYRPPLEHPPIASGTVLVQLADAEAAMAWFSEEHAALVAAVDASAAAGFPAHTVALASALTTFFDRRGHWSQWACTQRSAVEAARSIGDKIGQAHAHRRLARAYTRMSRVAEAESQLDAALELFAALDDDFGAANSHLDMASVMENQGRYADALHHATRALQIGPDKASLANAHNSIGWYHAQMGQHKEALAHGEKAMLLQQQLGNRDGEAHALDSVGFAHQRLGHAQLAARCFERALALFRELGDRYYEAIVLTHLASATGDRGGLAAALAILEDLGHPVADEVRAKLEAASGT